MNYSVPYSPNISYEVKVGDKILVRPDDRIPLDGVISNGESYVNESMLSGETMPVYKRREKRYTQGQLI